MKLRLLLVAAIVLFMTLSRGRAEALRGAAIALLSPAWEMASSGAKVVDQEALLSMQIALEKAELERENGRLRALIREMEHTLELPTSSLPLHRDRLEALFDQRSQAIAAQVIFRAPSTWGSSLWINIGATNASVVVGSPVVSGDALVGVIDYVGSRQSRVRLITDSGLTPAVRIARRVEGEIYYLAKGELQGASQPLWRSHGQLLKGVGFNYDFPDDEGPARDLRSGVADVEQEEEELPAMFIVQEGDLLITSGMDGFFPMGLPVATVKRISPLMEGDFAFELEALPVAGNLDDLSLLFVLPPVAFDPGDR